MYFGTDHIEENGHSAILVLLIMSLNGVGSRNARTGGGGRVLEKAGPEKL